MNILKVSFLSALSVAIKMLTLLIINKFVAYLFGPSGIAALGQFQNFQAAVRTLAQGGINSGVVKYISQFEDNEEEERKILASSVMMTLFMTFVISFIMFIFSNYLSFQLFETGKYSYILKTFSITLILFSLNQLLLSILNGYGEFKWYTLINVIQSLLGMALTLLLLYFFEFDGLLMSMVTSQSVFVFVLLLCPRVKRILKSRVDFYKNYYSYITKLLPFSLMSLSSALSLPIAMYAIRSLIINEHGWDSAGTWQAVVYISTLYMMVFSTVLSTYYLPKLSKTFKNVDVRKEILKGLYLFVPLYFLLSLILYFSVDFVIGILFTSKFLVIKELLPFYVLGDFFKLLALLFSYIMLAKSLTRLYLFTELVNYIFLYALSDFFIDYFGLVGVGYAYSISCLFYFCMVTFFLRKHYL